MISSLMRWRFRLIEKEFELDTNWNWIFPEWITGWVFYALIFLLTGSFWVRVEGARCFMYFLYSYACLMALFFDVCDWENHSLTNLVMCYLEDCLNKKKGESKRYEIDSSRMAPANPFSFSVDDASSFLRWWIVDGTACLLADYSNGSKAPFH